ncbi:unnamed protein product [Adineta steineri]|uniref:G-protein coupled receptors family 1 profile domain-containing protein n=1 Tax=Adineta steineri TaxID=433720 RepID=A0A814HNS4_9BILA|nr:unnamed protein product [Adineta steineri]CAF1011904.1 unnamed protein product [Adineta steineri]CAF3765168.1 unnamed protein product [Adineta steineri]CAF3894868.1 unnamed protein product [Adineta steineri]CAF3959852.1 unnamed protein product [Adineta steineri]
MNDTNDCEVLPWSEQAAKTVKPLLYICIIATIIHVLFWIQLIAYPIVRQWSMQWLYAYLTIDLLLLVRFFLLYAYRWWPTCVPYFLRSIICYCEAIFDNYFNLLQSYILLALNICRYLQIAHGHNVYSSNRYTILIAHFLIYFLPLFGHIIAIKYSWTVLQNPPGDACDLLPVSLTIRIIFLLLSYFIPVILTLVFLFLSLNYVRNTDGIRTQEIVDARQKYHRQIVKQSGVFYSLWIILWSPHLLVFPFYYKNSTIGTIAQLLNYINITLDPIIIAALDVRFLQAWQSTGDYLKRSVRPYQAVKVPVILTSTSSDSSHQKK